MSVVQERVFARLYRDSVELMAIASAVEAREGVDRVGLVMATPSNLAILVESQMLPEGLRTAPDDLLIVVRAVDGASADAALDEAERRLTAVEAHSGSRERRAPQTLTEGLTAAGDEPATLATISVPGEFAPIVVEQAIQAGLHVFCFSDNVPLADEVRLKAQAVERGLLLMGPDCGTAILDQVPLGFANVVRPGPVGIIAASGTGAQEISCLLDRAGTGISQLIGVGGRDLSEAVAGRMTLYALDLLAADPDTRVAVVVSKPPAPAVADRLLARLDALASSGQPVVACLLGLADTDRDSGVRVRGTLEGGAIAAAQAAGVTLEPAAPRALPEVDPVGAGGRVLGLYTGGTLASEARLILTAAGASAEVLDLGDDEYTAGKPHPMIDPAARAKKIADAGSDPSVSVVLLDLVLGYGSSPDPGTPVAEAVGTAVATARAAGRDLLVIGSVCGTDGDPQVIARQRDLLTAAGVVLVDSNAGASRLAARAMGGRA